MGYKPIISINSQFAKKSNTVETKTMVEHNKTITVISIDYYSLWPGLTCDTAKINDHSQSFYY